MGLPGVGYVSVSDFCVLCYPGDLGESNGGVEINFDKSDPRAVEVPSQLVASVAVFWAWGHIQE